MAFRNQAPSGDLFNLGAFAPTMTPSQGSGGGKKNFWYAGGSPVAWTVGGGTLSKNMGYYAPVIFGRGFTPDFIGFRTSLAAGAGTVMRCALYKDNGSGYPGTLLVEFGTVLCDTTGLKTIAYGSPISRGLYWTAMSPQGGAGGGPQTTPALSSSAGASVSHLIWSEVENCDFYSEAGALLAAAAPGVINESSSQDGMIDTTGPAGAFPTTAPLLTAAGVGVSNTAPTLAFRVA